MCNRYQIRNSSAEIARLFRVPDRTEGANFSDEVYPGYPGMVVTDGALRRMTWGFPLQLRGKQGQLLKPKPVNNARTDKLDSFMWRYSFEERRCLIPLTAWAEAEGPKGAMTCTWLSLPDRPVFAAAGIWRASDEWGDVYSMVMTDSCGPVADCHDRMPVILHAADHGIWTDGEPSEAKALCRPYEGAVALDRTTARWGSRSE